MPLLEFSAYTNVFRIVLVIKETAVAGRKMASFEDLKITLPTECSRVEQLAFLGTLSPQILTSDEVRELSLGVTDYIKAKKERASTGR